MGNWTYLRRLDGCESADTNDSIQGGDGSSGLLQRCSLNVRRCPPAPAHFYLAKGAMPTSDLARAERELRIAVERDSWRDGSAASGTAHSAMSTAFKRR
jgi:hypothetical protein